MLCADEWASTLESERIYSRELQRTRRRVSDNQVDILRVVSLEHGKTTRRARVHRHRMGATHHAQSFRSPPEKVAENHGSFGRYPFSRARSTRDLHFLGMKNSTGERLSTIVQ